MTKFDVYGVGNALVDKEFEVDDKFLDDLGPDKDSVASLRRRKRKKKKTGIPPLRIMRLRWRSFPKSLNFPMLWR